MRLPAGMCPPEHVYQVQSEMWASKRQWCDVISYHPDFPAPANLIIRRVARDAALIDEICTAVNVFDAEVEKEVSMIQEYMQQMKVAA
jgi:exodeoxyribonuclease (lambda-induced)